jgi:hypothetical protein
VHAVTTSARGLEIDQDEAFERRSYTVQRAGWILLAVLVVAAAAGLLGSGPLARATMASPGAFTVEYERLTRYQSSQMLHLYLEPGVTSAREVRVWIDRQFLDSSKIESVVPQPLRVEGAADRLYYVFQMGKPGERLFVAFTLQAEQIGRVKGRLGVGDTHEVAFTQLVYP